MLRILLATIGVCFLTGTSGYANLVWDKPIQEFERSPQDRAVDAKFGFKNTGTVPVTIERVKTTCGCTTAELEKKTYAPGESGEIAVKFNFGGRVGMQRKTVQVYTSDQADKPAVLDLRVNIVEPVTISPVLVFWRIGEPASPKKVQISASADRPVKVKSLTSSNPHFTASVETVKEGEQYVISLTPADTGARQSAEFQIVTDYPPESPRSYSVYARVK